MAIRNHITDPFTSNIANVIEGDEYDSGNNKRALVVATRPLKIFENKILFFTNPIYGANMNVGVSYGASPDIVYADNTPPGEWTTSTIIGAVGDFIEDSAGVAVGGPQAGTACIDATPSGNNDLLQLARDSSLNLTGYSVITGYCALTSILLRDGTKAIQLFGWDTTTSSQIGTIVDIGNYINAASLAGPGSPNWQKFTIPLEHMNLEGLAIDALRIRTVDTGGGSAPDYFLDTIQVEQSGTVNAATFTLEPRPETWLHVEGFSLFIADNSYDITSADNPVPAIPYDAILGVPTLDNGIVYQRIIGNETEESFAIRNIGNLLQLPFVTITDCGSATDGTKTWIKIHLGVAQPLVLKHLNQDRLVFIVSDDLSGLDVLTVTAHAKEESRPYEPNYVEEATGSCVTPGEL